MAMPTARQGASYAVIAALLIAPWEGLWTTAKPDRLANNLPTVCYGMTPGDRQFKIGDKFTPEDCMKFLIADIPKYRKGFEKCVKVELTEHNWAALTSAAYNAGPGAVCHSPMVRRFNAGQGNAACDSFIGWYETSMHVYRPGLHNRRVAESKICKTED